MAKKTKAKKKVPKTFTKVAVVFTSSASSLKEAKIVWKEIIFSRNYR